MKKKITGCGRQNKTRADGGADFRQSRGKKNRVPHRNHHEKEEGHKGFKKKKGNSKG